MDLRSPKKPESVTWTDSAEVIVVGGGAAGLSAAIEAAGRNASVILLEKNPQLGGSTALAIGSVSAAGTSVQRSANIEDSPEAYLEDLAHVTPHLEHRNNSELRWLLAFEAAKSIDWLKALGVHFYGPCPDSHNKVPRMHVIVPSTEACIKTLEKAARRKGCRIRTDCCVTKLIKDAGGRVSGVVAWNGNTCQSEAMLATRGVILAGGDYSSGTYLKHEYLPPGIAEIEGINHTATGDVHRLGMDAGAGVANMDMFHGPEVRFVLGNKKLLKNRVPGYGLASKMTATALSFLPKSMINHFAKEMLVSWHHPENSFFTHGAILVNCNGERFTDETLTPEREIAVARQPAKITFLVFDDTIAQRFSSWPNFVSTAPGLAYAYLDDYKHFRPDIFFEAATWEEVARRSRLPEDALAKAVREYNAAIEGESPDLFGRTIFGQPLLAPPFYVMGPAKAFVPTTDGGLLVSARLEVLTPDGIIIPGLYAAGTTGQGGLVHSSHGTGLGWAFTSGRLAGSHAAGAGIISKGAGIGRSDAGKTGLVR